MTTAMSPRRWFSTPTPRARPRVLHIRASKPAGSMHGCQPAAHVIADIHPDSPVSAPQPSAQADPWPGGDGGQSRDLLEPRWHAACDRARFQQGLACGGASDPFQFLALIAAEFNPCGAEVHDKLSVPPRTGSAAVSHRDAGYRLTGGTLTRALRSSHSGARALSSITAMHHMRRVGHLTILCALGPWAAAMIMTGSVHPSLAKLLATLVIFVRWRHARFGNCRCGIPRSSKSQCRHYLQMTRIEPFRV